jgi:beta-1,4-mannosyl-glycoprotein beta-1,4-N-acetylglucosaminyltransferase
MNVFDCCMFFNELDMLDLRFNVLNDVVDYFVVVESGMTHSGQPKPYTFWDAYEAGRYDAFKDKLIYARLPELQGANAWERERFHRAHIGNVLRFNAAPEDIVIVGDADEIVDPYCVHGFREVAARNPNWGAAKLELDFYYYDFNHRVRQGWAIGACQWWVEQDANRIRACEFSMPPLVVDQGGWHFSYFGDAAAIMQKAQAFMHFDWIEHYGLTQDKVQAALDAGKDLWGRNLQIERVPLNAMLPQYVRENVDKYAALGWLKPETVHG